MNELNPTNGAGIDWRHPPATPGDPALKVGKLLALDDTLQGPHQGQGLDTIVAALRCQDHVRQWYQRAAGEGRP